MTRKHFEAIAAALRSSGASNDTIGAVAVAIAPFNPSFNFHRFVAASRPLTEVVQKDGSVYKYGYNYQGEMV